MAGANPLIQVQNTLHSLQFAPYSLVHHHHQLMHQHTHHQRAFPPLLHQPSSVPPAAQDSGLQSNMQHLKPSLAAVTAFHRATQRSFSTKHGRCGALHVRIAWKIYYHKQLKKMQQNPNSPHREATPENPSAAVSPDSDQHERPEQPSSKRANPGSSCGQSAAYRNTGDRRETGLSTSGTRREKLEQQLLLQPQWRERLDDEDHRGRRTDATEDVLLGNEPWDQTVTRELDLTRDRKRQRECGGFVKVKRAKRETVGDGDDDQFPSIEICHADPSAFSATRTHPSPCTIPVQHLSDLSVLYPNSGRFNVARAPAGLFPYPGADMHPYRTASWEPTWDRNNNLHCRHIDYTGIRTPLEAQMQKAAFFRDLSAQSLFFPRASRKQETADVRGWDAPVVCPSTLLS